MLLDDVRELCVRLQEQTKRVVVGQEEIVRLMLVSLLCEGHILLEGVPGVAKTLLARTVARGLQLEFSRIQFTPDLMPGDVLGTNLFNFQTNEFVLTRGPVFTEFLLADEINRTPPKTQAALLEAMQERSVTIDGTSHALSGGFLVVATQNPIEQEGTYPLPEAQLDRFLFKLEVGYPSRDDERRMVQEHGHRSASVDLDSFGLAPVTDLSSLTALRAGIREIRVADEMIDYMVDIARATREHPGLLCGASPRSTNMLAAASRAFAATDSRDYVIPDDVKQLAAPVFRHRVVLAPGAEIDGSTSESVLKEVIEKVPAPR
ncbi:MAG: MoxR family ATPase [Planctomycetota bacterium]